MPNIQVKDKLITVEELGAAFNATVGIGRGGTDATTPAQARTNLEITPANIGALANSVIVNALSGAVETDTNAYISTGNAKICLLFVQRNSNGGSIYGVNATTLTSYVTANGVAVDLQNNGASVRILNRSGGTVTYLCLQLNSV